MLNITLLAVIKCISVIRGWQYTGMFETWKQTLARVVVVVNVGANVGKEGTPPHSVDS